MRASLLALSALVIFAANDIVSAAEPIYGQPDETKRIRDAMPVPGRAIIYIYRRHDDTGGPSPVIYLNTYQVGRLLPGTFTSWRVSPGQIEVRAEGLQTTRLPLTSQAGNIYLIRVSVKESARGVNARLTRVRPDARASELAGTQLLKNPREIPAALPKPAPVAPPPPRVAPAPTPPPAPPPPKPKPKAKVAPAKQIPPTKAAVILKLGTLTLADDTQDLFGMDQTFDDTASGVYALEGLYQLPHGITIGGELIGYSTEFTTTGTTNKHDVDVLEFFVNAKKYFRSDRLIQPFVGVGVGAATTDVSGPTISGDTSGLAYQLMAGVEFRFNRVMGLQVEAKYIGAETEDDNNEKIDVSGTGVFLGVGLHF
jgi:opacity protein-like surface antigen